MSEGDARPPIPRYRQVRTLIFDEDRQEQVAWLDAPIWPEAGSVLELGNPNRDARVIEVRLMLVQSGQDSEATILVLVEVMESTIPRRSGAAGRLTLDLEAWSGGNGNP